MIYKSNGIKTQKKCKRINGKMRKPKPPKPPKELCTTLADYLLGVVSPSRLLKYHMEIAMFEGRGEELTEGMKRVNKYFDDMQKYKIKMLERKIEKRKATREEYKEYKRKVKRNGKIE